MITEDYVSFETAKLLKEKGFNEWCFKCYGVAVLHNGADISFDEECDLRDYGREDEIEYVEGDRLYDYGCNNRAKDVKVWAAPTLRVAMKWLRKKHNLHITLPYYIEGFYGFEICDIKTCVIVKRSTEDTRYAEPEEACEAAIKYCLENLV